MNVPRKKQLAAIENKLVVTSGRWEGNIRVREGDIGCKIGSRMYCITRGT